jgi:hypothetical protein|tara:strand:+ start:568 stop:702 length:135 start_codon:yes stop_codon:yes gene_type:complete
MIKEEIKKLNIDLDESFMSGDYEKVLIVLNLIIEKINELEKTKK